MFNRETCSYWEEKSLEWSNKGCGLKGKASPPVCTCEHTTSFAIVVVSYVFKIIQREIVLITTI